MLKRLQRIWLRELARVRKAQQKEAGKLLKQILTPPKVKRAPRPKAARRPSISSLGANSLAGVPKKPAPEKRSRPGKPLPGKWLSSYYSTLTDSAALPARRMRYYLYLPSRFPLRSVPARSEADRWPLIVMLHGCEQSAEDFANGTRMNALAEQKGYAVLYPQQSIRSHPTRCWKWYDKATQSGGGDASLIVGTIEKILARYPIDKTRIYICGLSAGAAMAHIVALNHPDLIAAVGIHSGPLFGAGHNPVLAYGVMQHGAAARADSAIEEILQKLPAFPAMPTILIQGENDRVVRPINQVQLVEQTCILNHMIGDNPARIVSKAGGRAGGKNPAKAYTVRDYIVRRKLLLSVIRIAGLEHAWSGGDGKLAFNSSAKPDASRMMLSFFARHQRL